MQPNPGNLIEMTGIKTPLIGFYDVTDPKPFEPFTKSERCFFSAYEDWEKGDSICISAGQASCQGGGYWVGGVMPAWAEKLAGADGIPRDSFARSLNQREGFKSSDELMCQWLESQKPYQIKNGYVVIGPLRTDRGTRFRSTSSRDRSHRYCHAGTLSSGYSGFYCEQAHV